MRKFFLKQKGFTLIEVLTGITILSLLVIVYFTLFITISKSTDLSLIKTETNLTGQRIIENIKVGNLILDVDLYSLENGKTVKFSFENYTGTLKISRKGLEDDVYHVILLIYPIDNIDLKPEKLETYVPSDIIRMLFINK